MLATQRNTKAKPYYDGYVPPDNDAVDDSLMSKETFLAKIAFAEKEIEEGHYVAINSEEELRDYFMNL
jgi:hypothetical protein